MKSLSLILLASTFFAHAQEPAEMPPKPKPNPCWTISAPREISLNLKKEGVLPYSDNIEMSGKRVAGIISYSIDEEGQLELEREIFFPQLHQFKPSTSTWFFDYRAYLQDKYDDALLPKLYFGNQQFIPGPVTEVTIDGKLNFTHAPSKRGLTLERSFFPSMDERLFVESWTLTNTTKEALAITVGHTNLTFTDFGARGKFTRHVTSDAPEKLTLAPGKSTTFSCRIAATIEGETVPSESAPAELKKRTDFLDAMSSNLQLVTPDPTLNTLFEFSKIRASESIFESELGLIHSPGGGRYYVGIWANDQAEYINPFFAYLGYDVGHQSAMNCFRAFAKETKDDYSNIRYSFEIEGLVKPFLKDRGDAAMIAYGACQYALANGDEKTARELWPLIQWSLEYCHRKLNDGGVVASESDEMEGRIETGDANLSTSSLYYGALNLAAHLGKDLGEKPAQLETYRSQAKALATAIESYFGSNVEGLETYKYYAEHKFLRHWICLPLVVGIHDRKDATITALFDRLWTDNGVHVEKNSEIPKISKIFWDRGTLYALRGTFAAGDTKKSLEKLTQFSEQRLIGDRVPYVVEAYPEGDMAHLSAESALYCRVFTEGLFGLKPTGLGSFQLTPRLPEEWPKMELNAIRAFNQNFDVSVTRAANKLLIEISSGEKILATHTITPGESINFSFSSSGAKIE